MLVHSHEHKNLGIGFGEYDKIPNPGEAKGVAGSKNKHCLEKLAQEETMIGGTLVDGQKYKPEWGPNWRR